MYVSDTGLVPTLYKELVQINKTKPNNLILKSLQKAWTCIILKNISKWLRAYKKIPNIITRQGDII